MLQVPLQQDLHRILLNAFPEGAGDSANVKLMGEVLALIMLEELCYLFDGRRRYLSLSHQYIEWMEQIYGKVLPDEDYTYDRIARQFGFPPGQAAYLARVLKDRQNVELERRADEGLKAKLMKAKEEFETLDPQAALTQKEPTLILTHREFRFLRLLIEGLLQRGADVGDANKISQFPSSTMVSLHIDHIRKVLEHYDTTVRRL